MSSSKTATAPSNIITTTPYSDLTNTLTKSPTTPTSKARSNSTSENAYAQRAMNNTTTWQPKLDRRQSWSQEEYKHLMQSRSGSTGGAARLEGKEEGFTEGHF